MSRAQEGDTVTVTFQGTLEDGSIFDASDDSDPLTFVLGEHQVIPGLEMAVSGMSVGDRKTVTLDANHPLAGRPLTLQIELVSLDRPTLN